MNLNSVLNESKYDESVENLLTEIGNSYANWNPNNNADSVNQFRSGLKINPGRKFDKVIEKGRVWGFIAKKAGVNFLAYRCDISSKRIFIDKKLKIIND